MLAYISQRSRATLTQSHPTPVLVHYQQGPRSWWRRTEKECLRLFCALCTKKYLHRVWWCVGLYITGQNFFGFPYPFLFSLCQRDEAGVPLAVTLQWYKAQRQPVGNWKVWGTTLCAACAVGWLLRCLTEHGWLPGPLIRWESSIQTVTTEWTLLATVAKGIERASEVLSVAAASRRQAGLWQRYKWKRAGEAGYIWHTGYHSSHCTTRIWVVTGWGGSSSSTVRVGFCGGRALLQTMTSSWLLAFVKKGWDLRMKLYPATRANLTWTGDRRMFGAQTAESHRIPSGISEI